MDVVTVVVRRLFHDGERRDVCQDHVPAQCQGTCHYTRMLSRWKIHRLGEYWTQGSIVRHLTVVAVLGLLQVQTF